MATSFPVETIFRAVDRVSGPLTRMTSSVTRFANTAERSLGRVNSRLDATSSAVASGIQGIAAAGVAGGAAFAGIVQTGATFEQQITNAAAKFPGEIRRGTEAFAKLESAARRVGATTEFSASQAAGALNFLSMAGFGAQQAIGALPKIVDFATSSSLDLAIASDIASDALGQFNLTSTDAAQQTKNLARITDVMSRSATTANVTVQQLFDSFKDAGPVAAAAGSDIETVSTLAGTLANAGIKASQSGTALRAVFLRLQAPTGEAAKVIRRLGIQTRDSAGNMTDVIGILGQMGSALDGLGTSQRAEILKVVFGEDPIAAVNVLLAAGSEKLGAYREKLEQAAGSSAKMAAVMRDTTQADINGMTSAVEGLTITLFGFNRKGIREAVGGLTDWIRTIDGALQSNEELGKSIGQDVFDAVINLGKSVLVLIGAVISLKIASIAVSAAIVTFRVVSLAATTAMLAWNAAAAAMPAILATVRAAMLALNIVMAVNPVGLIVTAIGALIAIAAVLIASWGPVSGFFSDMWEVIKNAFTTAIDGIMLVTDPFLGVVNSVSSIWSKLKGVVSDPITAEINTKQSVSTTAGDGVISPQEGVMRSINESKSSAEVTLRNETNSTAEVSRSRGPMNLQIANSGDF